MTAYSLISGNRFFPCNPGSSCDPCTTACNPGNPAIQGSFAADFFAAGSYKISVEQIDRRFTAQSGIFVGPLATPALLTGPEEYYDALESGTASDDPDDYTAVAAGSGTPINIALDTLPTSDAFEPNNSFGTASVMDDLPSGSDTAAAVLDTADLDVLPGSRRRRPARAHRHRRQGARLEPGCRRRVLQRVERSRRARGRRGRSGYRRVLADPATEIVANFTGTAKIKVSSYPDLDQDGVGGGSTGGYWLRVEVATDTDGDGAPDAEDICPTTAKDDADRDGLVFRHGQLPHRLQPDAGRAVQDLGPRDARDRRCVVLRDERRRCSRRLRGGSGHRRGLRAVQRPASRRAGGQAQHHLRRPVEGRDELPDQRRQRARRLPGGPGQRRGVRAVQRPDRRGTVTKLSGAAWAWFRAATCSSSTSARTARASFTAPIS